MADPEDYQAIEDAPDDLEEFDDELEEMASDLTDLDAEIRDLIEAVRGETEASLRLAVRYSGDDTGLLYIREDLQERYSEPELAERVDSLVMKGLGDPPREESLFDFGRLDATIRWYDEVLVATFHYREWSGLVFAFDREDSPLVDLAAEFLRE
jgi:hypothetical protein